MKKANIFFIIAGVFFLGALIFGFALVFAPKGNTSVEEAPEQIVEEEISEEELLLAEAEAEVERFKKEHEMVIPVEEMLKQIRIRKAYEADYGQSYPMEEVFLAEGPQDESVGDPGYIEEDLTEIRIAVYKRLYNFDESRYASLTVEQQLEALQVEYGPLPEEEEQKIQEYMQANEQSVTEFFEELKKQEEKNAQGAGTENVTPGVSNEGMNPEGAGNAPVSDINNPLVQNALERNSSEQTGTNNGVPNAN